MDIIKTGIGIRKTIKNVGRFKEIITVLAQNGFDELIIRAGLSRGIPGFVLPRSRLQRISEMEKESWPAAIGDRLRRSFEELGPGFVKLGQVLASREDLFDSEFTAQMRRLQDNVRGIPFAEAMNLLTDSLGRPYEEVFRRIDPAPIGTASIGVVYRGQLKSGETVVIKIRRPEILKNISSDFEILDFIVQAFENIAEPLRYLGLSRILHELSRGLAMELNFSIERMNCEKFTNYIGRHDKEGIIYVPQIFREYCSESVLVMEFIDGIPFTRLSDTAPRVKAMEPRITRAIDAVIKVMFLDGFFHSDLHGGNLFLMSEDRIGVIDFGLCGTITSTTALTLVSVLQALAMGQYENLVYEVLDIAEYEGVPDAALLINDVKDAVSPWIGLRIQDLNTPRLLQSLVGVLARHRIYLPREWLVIIRGIVAVEGLGKSLGLDLDFMRLISGSIDDIVKNQFTGDRLKAEGYWLTRNLLSTMRVVPRHMKWFLKESARNRYGIELIHRGHEKDLQHLRNALVFLGYVLAAAVLFYAGTSRLDAGQMADFRRIPLLIWIFWSLSALLFVRGLFLIRSH